MNLDHNFDRILPGVEMKMSLEFPLIFELHPGKRRWQWKINHLKMYLPLKKWFSIAMFAFGWVQIATWKIIAPNVWEKYINYKFKIHVWNPSRATSFHTSGFSPGGWGVGRNKNIFAILVIQSMSSPRKSTRTCICSGFLYYRTPHEFLETHLFF